VETLVTLYIATNQLSVVSLITPEHNDSQESLRGKEGLQGREEVHWLLNCHVKQLIQQNEPYFMTTSTLQLRGEMAVGDSDATPERQSL
jgi:hypothetical protein